MYNSPFKKQPLVTSPMSTATEYQYLVDKLFYFPIKLRFLHHNTTSYAKHKALDFAYEATSDLQDDIIEKLIGCTSQRYKSPTIEPCGEYSDEACFETAEEIKEFAKRLKNYAESKGYLDISQQADTYEGVGAKLSYLLSLS